MTPARPPHPLRGVAYGILATILTAAIMAFVREYDHSKLDASRFEKDSIAKEYERRADRLILESHSRLLVRVDSTTQAILRTHK